MQLQCPRVPMACRAFRYYFMMDAVSPMICVGGWGDDLRTQFSSIDPVLHHLYALCTAIFHIFIFSLFGKPCSRNRRH